MGGGDDKIVIAEGAELKGMLDFGSGTDTLIWNGTIHAWGGFDISGLEKLSGNGTLVWCGGEEVNLSDSLIDRLKNAGITIINGLNYGYDFESVKAEKADDTINGTGVKVLSEEDDYCGIWLCGSEKANSVDFGFTDAVDYVKIVKNSSWDEMYMYMYIGGVDMESDCYIELLDKNGNHLEDVVLSDGGDTYIDDLKNGTYYLKFTVASNSSCGGWIELE